LIVFLQARVSSKRLPKKVLEKINNEEMFIKVYNCIKRSKKIQKIIVTTSKLKSDDKIVNICKTKKIEYFRGHLSNVSKRIKDLIMKLNLKREYFIRISADSPFIDFKLIEKFMEIYKKKKPDILTNVYKRTFPIGQSIELIKTSFFIKHQKKFKTQKDREHVTPYFYRNFKNFKIINIKNKKNYSKINMSVDTYEDLKKIRNINKKVLNNKYISWKNLVSYF
tara:strand:+ start:1881 stop:2549 length:669 start_codon:yes stop_codon:yes gene_type:complete